MPIYITRGRYSLEALKNLAANPQDRGPAVAKLAEAAGAKLLNYYVTTGETDWMTIVEAPNAGVASAVIIGAATGGGVTDVVTVEAFTSADAKNVFALAGKASGAYKAPGK
ncbi:MAG: GYD domain-containing protein [Geminicoccaceae bacterium]